MSVEPEMEFSPEVEFRPEIEIPAETCDAGLGTARPITDVASQYITADKPEVTASYTSQEVTTSFPILHTQTAPVDNTIHERDGRTDGRTPGDNKDCTYA